MSRGLVFMPQCEHRLPLFEGMLEAAGVKVTRRLEKPQPGDLLVVWNRYGASHSKAREFEKARGVVLVVENGYFGEHWRGSTWYALARSHHAGAGRWFVGGPERWDSWGVELAPWRKPGGECVILAQRQIGEPALRSPAGWPTQAHMVTHGRIRRHPRTLRGMQQPDLAADLEHASSAATWSSAAGLQALALGVPVFCGMPGWIGAEACKPLTHWLHGPRREDAARLAMFRRMAWAMFTEAEVAAGTPVELNVRDLER